MESDQYECRQQEAEIENIILEKEVKIRKVKLKKEKEENIVGEGFSTPIKWQLA